MKDRKDICVGFSMDKETSVRLFELTEYFKLDKSKMMRKLINDAYERIPELYQNYLDFLEER